MLTLSSGIKSKLNNPLGAEPVLIVDIDWNSGSIISYSDQKINGAEKPLPYVINVGQLDTSAILTGSGDSQTVSVQLDDIDGSLRNLIDTYDLQKRPVSIYLGFQGIAVSDRVLLFQGVAQTPIVWDEGGRSLSFEVLSELDSPQVGFTMDDGRFPFVPPEDRNKAWPLVFGQVCNMQTVKVTSLRKGFLAEGQGVKDPTIEDRLCQAQKLQCPKQAIGFTSPLSDNTDPLFAFLNEDGTSNLPWGGVTGNSTPTLSTANVRVGKQDLQCTRRRFNEICGILNSRAQQDALVKDRITIRGGNSFPQNQTIRIRINDVKFDGIMNGEDFAITQVIHPDDVIENPECKDINDSSVGFRLEPSSPPTTLAECAAGGTDFRNEIVDGSGESWRYYKTFKEGRFIWLPPGTEVFLDDEADLVHIVSLLPGTVNEVAAYRTFGDTTLLTEVPTDLYTVQMVDYGGYDVVEVHLNRQLSQIEDANWSDDIHVSFTSSIGPNPTDIITYLIEKYTDITVDTVSFTAVRLQLANYGLNFSIKARPNVLDVVKDIAYQSRCAVTIKNGVISITYLSSEPTSVRTFTEDDIIVSSFRISHTNTDDLITHHQINWQETEAGVNQDDDVELQFVLKHNVPKYGVISRDYDYFGHNLFSGALKTATFWMIRQAHTWKLLEFDVPMRHIDIEVFDAITVNISQFVTTKCIVEKATYDIENNLVSIRCWTPIRSGESSPYFWAWPALQDANAVFPLADSDQSGDGFNFTVEPPVGHPLRGGFDDDISQVWTDGDRNPSDLDDVFEVVRCKISTGAEIADDIEPTIVPFEPLAEENFSERLDEIEAGGNSGSSDDDKEETACGDPIDSGSCKYEVIIQYISPDSVTTQKSAGASCNDAGPCKGDAGRTGRPCTGTITTFCHSFGALFAATAFRSMKAQEAQALFDNCAYAVGKFDVLAPGPITPIPGTGPFGECESVPDINEPAAAAGETHKPVGTNGESFPS